MNYTLVDDALTEHLQATPEDHGHWLFLEPHPDFQGQWRVDSFDPHYFYDFESIIGPYRAVAPFGLDEFIQAASDYGYQVAFFEDPATVLADYDRLNDVPEVTLNSDLPGTEGGFLPYQVQGFNFLKDLDAGVAMWSTGTGKTVLASALLKYHVARSSFDTAFVIVKAHNKVNTQRAVRKLADVETTVVHGEKDRRRLLYADIANGDPSIVITNYEKLRVDQDLVLPLFEDRRILIVWDEMPTKLKTRTTKLYTAVCKCLYSTRPPIVNAKQKRPRHLRQYMLSATPIEKDPSDWFNCIRLMDPEVYGTVKEFEAEFVATWNWFDPNKPERWHKLDKMGLKAAHITHQVDKDDPDIAAQFPDVLDQPLYIDWDDADRKIYDKLVKKVRNDDEISAVALITVLQMLACAPTMLLNSAAVYEAYAEAYGDWDEAGKQGKEPPRQGSELAALLVADVADMLTNDRHTKIDTLRELLCETHRGEKVVVFSSFNAGLMPILEEKLEGWSVPYVRYIGTDKQKQNAEDAFRDDPDVRVFLTSDMGSDSINLEAGSVVIHYDLPWNWSTKIQRQNRIHRVSSTHQKVRYYTLMMANSVEDRKAEVIERKFQFHKGVFKGAIADQSASARMTKEDLMFILMGD